MHPTFGLNQTALALAVTLVVLVLSEKSNVVGSRGGILDDNPSHYLGV
jgi:hypothetical protein